MDLSLYEKRIFHRMEKMVLILREKYNWKGLQMDGSNIDERDIVMARTAATLKTQIKDSMFLSKKQSIYD
jgi:hypothetical protein